jgi:hypothetical protein
MITPARYNLTCYQGATFDQTFTVSIDNAPMNLTGYSAAMQVRETIDSSSAAVSLTNGSGITLGGTAGTIQVVIAATATSALTEDQYVYDLELTSGGGIKDRYLMGTFIVSGEVTRG